jgi:hypothetical protein
MDKNSILSLYNMGPAQSNMTTIAEQPQQPQQPLLWLRLQVRLELVRVATCALRCVRRRPLLERVVS